MDVSEKLAEIKMHMPGMYQAIKERAAKDGNLVYELVRRGLRGEKNCFYGWSDGRVVGTRWDTLDVDYHLALGMIQFGPAAVCLINVSGLGRT